MAVVDITEFANAIELDFAPSGITRKVIYPRSSFGFVTYMDFLGTFVTQVTSISENLVPSQITGVALNETPNAPDPNIIRIRNWNNVLVDNNAELYEKIKVFMVS
jgi:hypothetical protein